MPQYLLDTNTLIYAYRGQGRCREQLALARPADLALSSVVVFEIEYGLAKSTNPVRLRTYLTQVQARCAALNWCEQSATKSAQLRAHLERQGQVIGPYDLLIAGSALAHNLTLVTHNTREFERVPGLRLEDWYD